MAKQYVCTTCGFIGKRRKRTRGSFLLEVFLWLLFLLPGLVYTIWRSMSKEKICPQCENPTMIPADSPMGQKFLAGVQK